MKFKLALVSSLLLLILGTADFTRSVLAVGSGSGGSVPTCTEDQWSCGDWTTCSAQGIQKRTCTLTFDCSAVTTPKPPEQESCTPPAPPVVEQPQTPVNPSTNASGNSNESSPATSCREDKWECGQWSPVCDIYGRQVRTCKQVFDCPSATTPPPATFRACERLQCGNLPDLKDRVSCRLNLAPAGIAREYEIKYLPEECRELKDQTKQKACVARYKSYEPCWKVEAGEKRFACARDILKLGPVLSEEVKTCQGKKGAEQVQCKAEVKDKVFSMIKFRFYDLEERAEDLARKGANLQDVAEFVSATEQQKQAFDKAQTKQEQREIILVVRAAWKSFVQKIKAQVK